jgi:hypothetical protein
MNQRIHNTVSKNNSTTIAFDSPGKQPLSIVALLLVVPVACCRWIVVDGTTGDGEAVGGDRGLFGAVVLDCTVKDAVAELVVFLKDGDNEGVLEEDDVESRCGDAVGSWGVIDAMVVGEDGPQE